jgi:predicted DNA-binding transcriptional regulator AlpA
MHTEMAIAGVTASAGEGTTAAHSEHSKIELMDKDETCRFFDGQIRPINHATLYRGIASGRYPRPIKVGANSSRWIKSECMAALQNIIAERAEKSAA